MGVRMIKKRFSYLDSLKHLTVLNILLFSIFDLEFLCSYRLCLIEMEICQINFIIISKFGTFAIT